MNSDTNTPFAPSSEGYDEVTLMVSPPKRREEENDAMNEATEGLGEVCMYAHSCPLPYVDMGVSVSGTYAPATNQTQAINTCESPSRRNQDNAMREATNQMRASRHSEAHT